LGDEIGAGDGEPKRLIASIIAEVDRLTEITETYLRFTRLPRPKLEREDLAAIVASVMELSRGELAQGGIAVVVDVEPGLPEVAADEAQLRQALINLIRNAREAMSTGRAAAPPAGPKRLEVSLRGERGRVLLRIRDSGPGIAAADMGKIFDPFFSTKERGTGLGLALVQQIVVDHGGQIDVESAPGQGTAFTIALPVAAAGDPSLGGRGAVGLGATAVSERVVEGRERAVEGGRVGGLEGERALEGGGGGGRLARGGQGAA
jgi:signal transduction histidine kinase